MATKAKVLESQVESTVKELYKVIDVCGIVEENVTDDKSKARTKVGIALRAFVMHTLQPALESYQREIQSINAKFCKTDSDGCIIYDSKDRMKFTPENDEKRRAAIEDAKGKTIIIDRHIVKEVKSLPDTLSSYDVELLEKFLIFN